MKEALLRKAYALAILLVFVLLMWGGYCDACKKNVDEAKMFADQASASVAKAVTAVWK